MNEEYNLPLGLDIQAVINKGAQVKSILADLNTQAENFQKKAQTVFSNAASSADAVGKGVTGQSSAFVSAIRQMENMEDALRDLKILAFNEQDATKVKLYGAEIAKLERQIRQAANAGKAGFDASGNAMKGNTAEIRRQIGYQETLNNRIKIYQQAIAAQPNTAKGAQNIVALNKALEKSQNELNKLTNAGRTGFDDLGNKIQKASGNGVNFVGVLRNIAGAFGIAFGLSTLVQVGKELFNMATQADGIERAFTKLGDSKALDNLRSQTGGFISDLDLERLTVKANNFNIPMEKLGGFLLFAQQRAKDTGEDVNKLTDNIIDGLGRKSARIIDNLGISIVDIQKEFRKTGDFTTAVSNLIAKEMGRSGVYVETLTDRTNKLSVAWQNAKQAVSEYFFQDDTAPNNKVIGTLTADLKTQYGLIKASQEAASNFQKKNAEDRNKIIDSQTAKLLKISNALERARQPFTVKEETIIQNRGGDITDEVDRSAKLIKKLSEQLVSEQNIQSVMKKQNEQTNLNLRLQQGILSTEEKRQKVTKLTDDAFNIVPVTDADKKLRADKLKQAAQLQKEIDEESGKAQKKRDKTDETDARKRLQRQKELNDQRVKLENDYYSAQIEAIDDATTKSVASETVKSQNTVRELENRKTIYPELTRQINNLIEEEQKQSAQRVLLIIAKGEEEQLKARKASSQEIAKVLGDDTSAQVDAINESYELIRQNAKKAGTLTAETEKKLAIAQQKDVTNAVIKGQDDTLKKQEELALSAIYIRKRREGQSEKSFEQETQQDILKINIEFAQKRLALIAADPAKVKEANDLKKAIQDAQNSLDKLKGKTDGKDLFDELGIDPEKLRNYSDAISKFGEVTSDFFGGLADAAQGRVDAIQTQIDAIDELVNAQQEAVNKEKDLMDKGYANNYNNAVRTLNAQKEQRAQLVKEQQEAQRKQQELQRAQIIADSFSQASNLVTASSEIFKVFSKIPFIGVPLAIAAIATMFGAFTISKVNALNATKLAKGGTIGGKSHSEGGNKFISIDGNGGVDMMEHERGEEVTKRTSAEKHRKLLKAINNDDFSSISLNDYSLKQLLEGTGVITQMEVAKEASKDNITMVEKSRTFVINSEADNSGYLKEMAGRLATIEKQNNERPEVVDMGDFVLIIKPNYTQKIWKK